MRALYPQDPDPRKILENKLRLQNNRQSVSDLDENLSFFQRISEDKVTDKLTFKEKFYNILQVRVDENSMRKSRESKSAMTEQGPYTHQNGKARFERPNTTLDQFRDLSDQFDQMQQLKRSNIGQVEDIYNKFDLDKAILHDLGVDQTKKQIQRRNLVNLLNGTKDMNQGQARKNF